MVHKEKPGSPNADEQKKCHPKLKSNSHMDMKEKENGSGVVDIFMGYPFNSLRCKWTNKLTRNADQQTGMRKKSSEF